MGGSGSGRNFSDSADTAWNPAGLAESVKRTRQLQDRVELEQLFDETVGRINQFDTEEMAQHKQTILNALRDEFEGLTDLQGGGSRTRHTYVDGLSDVDFLADLGPYSQSSVPSKNDSAAVIAAMADRIQRRLPLTEVTPGRMAVTIRFADGHELQVLPAFRYHSGYRVPDAEGSGWVLTRPSVFAQLLRARNADTGGRLLRIIKLGKLMCAKADVGIKSYECDQNPWEGSRTLKAIARWVILWQHHPPQGPRRRAMTLNVDMSVQQIQQDFQALVAYVTGPDTRMASAYTVELTLFRHLLAVGAALLRVFFQTRAAERPAGPVHAPDGAPRGYHDRRVTTYYSVFGKVRFARHDFTAAGQAGVCPLDAELSLPARSYSGLLQEWGTYGTTDASYHESGAARGRILGLEVGSTALETMVADAAVDVEDFHGFRWVLLT